MPPPHGLRESDHASRPHHLLRIAVLPATESMASRVATMPSCISPEVPVRRRPSFSATRLWRATALGPGAVSSWQIGVALAVRTRSSVSSTVRRSSRRPTSTRFSRSRKCARAVPPTNGPRTCRNARPLPQWRISRRSGSRWKCSQLTLVGGSCGRAWRWILRQYGSRVRAVVLESPVTPATHAPERFGQFAQHALDALLDECLGTPECAREFPAIREEARQVFDRLRQGPVKAIAAHPSAGRPAEVTLTRDHVGEAIRYLMYSSRGASRVPLCLHEAFKGNFRRLPTF